jgi:hypothetical protein
MNKFKLAKTLGVLLLTFCAVNTAQAVLLSDLLNGGSLTAADKVFDQWAVTFQDASDASVPDYTNINVNPLNDGGLHPGPGISFDFGNQMSVTGDDIYAYSDLTLDFHVSSLGGLIEDNSLSFLNNLPILDYIADGINDLGVAVEEWVYADAANTILLGPKDIESSVLDDTTTLINPDWAQFTPQQEIFVKKNFLTWSTDPTDTATLKGVEQRFSQVQVQMPEPVMLLLLSAGLVGFGYAKRGQI